MMMRMTSTPDMTIFLLSDWAQFPVSSCAALVLPGVIIIFITNGILHYLSLRVLTLRKCLTCLPLPHFNKTRSIKYQEILTLVDATTNDN